MPDAVKTAAANMAAAYDANAFARGLIQGAAATIEELVRQGLLPAEKKESEQ